MSRVLYFLATFAEAGLGVFGLRLYEQPRYEVVRRLSDGVEVRRYEPREAVETTVDGPDRRRAAEEAFGRLFRYITGANGAAQTIAMTAPVQRGPADTSRLIAMTAPVQTAPADDGGVTMRFFIPRDVASAGAPAPTDPRVHLVVVPAQTLAARRFSGVLSEADSEAQARRLLAALARDGAKPAGTPFVMGYDAPFTLPFLRRNEVAVPLEHPPV